MCSGNYPPGMTERDWQYVNGDHLIDDDENEEEDEPTFPDDVDYDPCADE